MLSCLIFNSSVDRGIPSLVSGRTIWPGNSPIRAASTSCFSKRLKVLMWIEAKEGLLEIDTPN
jgi:hypothetical protein